MTDHSPPRRREQSISIVTDDLESTLCSSATETSTSIDSPESTQSPGLPSGLVRRSNSLRSRPAFASRPASPTVDTTKAVEESPDIVVLCLWPYATDSQISFYLDGYTDLYPSAQVLALRSSWGFESPGRDDVLDRLTESSDKFSAETGRTVLLHLFGHTGALNATSLLRTYRARTQQPLNVKAIISDAEPTISLASFQSAYTSSYQFILCIYIAFLGLWRLLATTLNFWEYHTAANRIREDLTDTKLLPPDVRTCFVFAQQNLMFSWHHAVEAGEAAERQDLQVRRTSVDAKGRWTGDQERYWLGIEGVWGGRY